MAIGHVVNALPVSEWTAPGAVAGAHLCSALEPQFRQHAGDVGLGCRDADGQQVRDLIVAVALCDEVQHLTLPLGESVQADVVGWTVQLGHQSRIPGSAREAGGRQRMRRAHRLFVSSGIVTRSGGEAAEGGSAEHGVAGMDHQHRPDQSVGVDVLAHEAVRSGGECRLRSFLAAALDEYQVAGSHRAGRKLVQGAA